MKSFALVSLIALAAPVAPGSCGAPEDPPVVVDPHFKPCDPPTGPYDFIAVNVGGNNCTPVIETWFAGLQQNSTATGLQHWNYLPNYYLDGQQSCVWSTGPGYGPSSFYTTEHLTVNTWLTNMTVPTLNVQMKCSNFILRNQENKDHLGCFYDLYVCHF